MLKFISAVLAAAAFAAVLMLLSATSTRLDARLARDAAPQSTPATQTAPALAAAAISPELVRLDEVVRDFAEVVRRFYSLEETYSAGTAVGRPALFRHRHWSAEHEQTENLIAGCRSRVHRSCRASPSSSEATVLLRGQGLCGRCDKSYWPGV
jgi:hypothetical protein